MKHRNVIFVRYIYKIIIILSSSTTFSPRRFIGWIDDWLAAKLRKANHWLLVAVGSRAYPVSETVDDIAVGSTLSSAAAKIIGHKGAKSTELSNLRVLPPYPIIVRH